MTPLEWDKIEERKFETGIDRGVLYRIDGTFATVWNGLVSVAETGSSETKSYYYQGLKVHERHVPGAYSAKVEAFTYPDLLDELTGIIPYASGVRVHDGRPEPFHLCYRTRIGDPVDGIDHGYKLHLVYNVLAKPEGFSSKTVGEAIEPNLFAWTLSGMQKSVDAGQPIDHISIDSTDADPVVLQALEDKLYGTIAFDPDIPPPDNVLENFAP